MDAGLPRTRYVAGCSKGLSGLLRAMRGSAKSDARVRAAASIRHPPCGRFLERFSRVASVRGGPG